MQERIYVPELLDPKEVCKLLGVSRATLDRMRAAHPNFPRPFTVGSKSLRFDKRSLVEWLNKQNANAQRAGGAQ